MGIAGNCVHLKVDLQREHLDQVGRVGDSWVFLFGHGTQVRNPIFKARFQIQTYGLRQHSPRLFRVSALRRDVKLQTQRDKVATLAEDGARKLRMVLIILHLDSPVCPAPLGLLGQVAPAGDYLSLVPFGTSCLKVASTGLPSGPAEAATTIPFDSTPRSFLGSRFATSTIFMPTRSSGL
jgi:hypothetical protein